MPIVLASASPRRQELLKNAGISFVARPANIDEVQRTGEGPVYFAERMAREKARAARALAPESVVLGADTIVVARDQVLGKPTDAADAVRMLRLLSNRQHFVITGVCLIGTDSQERDFEDVRSEKTASTLRRSPTQKFATTLPLASRWTKPAPMPFKAGLLAGFQRLKAITTMWWDCRLDLV